MMSQTLESSQSQVSNSLQSSQHDFLASAEENKKWNVNKSGEEENSTRGSIMKFELEKLESSGRFAGGQEADHLVSLR